MNPLSQAECLQPGTAAQPTAYEERLGRAMMGFVLQGISGSHRDHPGCREGRGQWLIPLSWTLRALAVQGAAVMRRASLGWTVDGLPQAPAARERWDPKDDAGLCTFVLVQSLPKGALSSRSLGEASLAGPPLHSPLSGFAHQQLSPSTQLACDRPSSDSPVAWV